MPLPDTAPDGTVMCHCAGCYSLVGVMPPLWALGGTIAPLPSNGLARAAFDLESHSLEHASRGCRCWRGWPSVCSPGWGFGFIRLACWAAQASSVPSGAGPPAAKSDTVPDRLNRQSVDVDIIRIQMRCPWVAGGAPSGSCSLVGLQLLVACGCSCCCWYGTHGGLSRL